jgi:hypothetical protein
MNVQIQQTKNNRGKARLLQGQNLQLQILRVFGEASSRPECSRMIDQYFPLLHQVDNKPDN